MTYATLVPNHLEPFCRFREFTHDIIQSVAEFASNIKLFWIKASSENFPLKSRFSSRFSVFLSTTINMVEFQKRNIITPAINASGSANQFHRSKFTRMLSSLTTFTLKFRVKSTEFLFLSFLSGVELMISSLIHEAFFDCLSSMPFSIFANFISVRPVVSLSCRIKCKIFFFLFCVRSRHNALHKLHFHRKRLGRRLIMN